MPADGSASTKCASARYSDRHGTDVDAAGARSRAMDPDESTIHSSYKSCSEKCSRGANQAYPTSLSRFAARDSLVTPETPPDRTPVPTRKRASAPGALNLAMRRHPVLSGRPGRFYPIGGSRSPHVWLGEGCSTLDHYGRGFVLIRLGTNAPDVSALKSEAEVRSENDTGPGYQEGGRSADLHDAAGSFSNRWLDGFFDPHVGEGQVAPRPVAIPAHAGRRRGKKISGASRRDSFVLRNNFAGPLSIAAA
jgi:hypothetical protein